MEWNENEKQFKQCKPKPSPTITVNVSILKECYEEDFKKDIPETDPVNIIAIADSGCQTSTAGKGILKMMGLPEKILMDTRHRIVGVTDTSLDIIGVLLMRIRLKDKESCQMVYISNSRSDMYLSETCLQALGIIPESFPEPQPSKTATCKSETLKIDDEKKGCKCIPRSNAPRKPDRIPYTPSRENVPKLKQWLLENFSASAFNRCTHQELPVMSGEPMDILFKEGAIPYAVHTPIKVPIHWEKEVKEGLDQDVRLGIIEKVPPGTPVTWCSRMVTAAKKNGKPRRTTDNQKLKESTLRETHFTPSPFNTKEHP